MNRKSRFLAAIGLSIVIMLIAASAWAAPKFQGTVPPVPQLPVTGECLKTVNMGTAIFTVESDDCIRSVELISNPSEEYAPAPESVNFVGDTFKVITTPEDAIVQVCYAYPPEFEDTDAAPYRLNEEATPMVWVEIPGAEIGDGTICVGSAAGVFSLIGNLVRDL